MAKSAEVSMNVSAIRLVDRLVCDIVDTATHVVLYEFNHKSSEWEKTNAEGALFIYSRNGNPRYKIIVLNRLNTHNLVEPVDEGIDLQLQEPFLLYRNSRGEIHGIWFYDRDESLRLAKTIDRLIKEIGNIKCPMETRLKIGSELFKPQQPETPDGTSKRVMDFFARAGSKAPSQPPGPRAPPPGLSREQQLSDVNPLLQRLMSNPNPITVEQLEKQQRSSPSTQDVPKIRTKSIIKKDNARRPLTLPIHSSPKIENGMNLLQLGESPPKGYTPSSITTQHFFNSAIPHSPSEPLEVSVLEQSVTMETPTKPALIPPVMFASAKEETPLVVKPEPLTKSQLLQAVTYLLKNDADFINKLHEAYVKSFVDMVS